MLFHHLAAHMGQWLPHHLVASSTWLDGHTGLPVVRPVVQALRPDRGQEDVNNSLLADYFQPKGLTRQTPAPYSPQHNGTCWWTKRHGTLVDHAVRHRPATPVRGCCCDDCQLHPQRASSAAQVQDTFSPLLTFSPLEHSRPSNRL